MVTITKSPRDNIVVRINQCTAPIGPGYSQTTGWSNNWFGAGGAGTNAVSTGELDKTWTTKPTSVADAGWFYTDTTWLPNTWRHVIGRIFCNGFVGRVMIRATFYNSASTQLALYSSTPTSVPAGSWTQFEGTWLSPAGTATVKIEMILIDNGVLPNVGNGMALSQVLIEDGNVYGTTGYFDGNTYAAGSGTQSTVWAGAAGSSASLLRDFDPANVISPQLVEGWDQVNPSRNTFYDLLDDTYAVVLRAAGARTGVLRLLFGGVGVDPATARAAAVTAASQHVKAATFIYSDATLGGLTSFSYATNGDVRLYLTDTRQSWRLDIPYREV